MTLPTKEAAQKGFYSLYSPMMRWLQEMVTKQLEAKTVDQDEVPLKSLHIFCSESADLVKAFNTTNHKLLFQILQKYDVPPKMLDTIRCMHQDYSLLFTLDQKTNVK